MCMGSVRQVAWNEILGDANFAALMAEYADECSIPEIGAPAPDREAYDMLERSGYMQCFGAYDGNLVGFAVVLTAVVPHYSQRIATVESVFVAKGHRASGIGAALLRKIERHARAKQCRALMFSAPVGSDFHKCLAGSMSFRHTGASYCKRLG